MPLPVTGDWLADSDEFVQIPDVDMDSIAGEFAFMAPHRPGRVDETGIAKLFGASCVGAIGPSSGGHFCGMVMPKGERVRAGVTAMHGVDFVAAGAEDQIDLVVGSKEPRCFPGCLEPSEYHLPLSCRPVRDFDRIIEPIVRPMFGTKPNCFPADNDTPLG